MDQNLQASLTRLALRPPQVLLLEGGTESQRFNSAIFWAQTVNCPQALKNRNQHELAFACGACPTCKQIAAYEFNDLFIYDGRIANKQDEEKPGPILALRMEHMRALKIINAEAPRSMGKRVAIFQGMTQTREEAMNSLLKTLEEPSPHTLFVLLTPQRAQLLETLVSRSLCLTLAWPGAMQNNEECSEWLNDFANFLKTGKGLLDKTGSKNALTAEIAFGLLTTCQNALVRCLGSIKKDSEIDTLFIALKTRPQLVIQINAWITEAMRMLSLTVSPARVLEAFAAKLFCILHSKPGI